MRTLLQSMTTRIFLILVGGVLVTAVLAAVLALSERQRMIGQFRDHQAAERAAQFLLSLESIPPELRPFYYEATARAGMRATEAGAREAVLPDPTALAARLEQRLPEDFMVASAPAGPDDCAQRGRGPERRERCEALLVTLPDGESLRLTVLPPSPPAFVPRMDSETAFVVFLLSIGLLAALIARMTMRPLRRLAEAATALGQDIDRAPLPETGAREIRQAAAAFNAMQARIRRHIRQRTQILAAITHDLQTPLTRLRLRLEKVEDAELRDKLLGDLAAMQSMVREGLELGRSMDSPEPLRALDLDSLVDSVCEDAVDAGQDVRLEARCAASVPARPLALRRCLENLIGNAVKYGGSARLSCSSENGRAVVRVRDAGPGIPEDDLEKVFEPFHRLETSRSRETGGTGLGLTIARNIAEQHGGTLVLRNHPEGGLEAVLSLPLQAGHDR